MESEDLLYLNFSIFDCANPVEFDSENREFIHTIKNVNKPNYPCISNLCNTVEQNDTQDKPSEEKDVTNLQENVKPLLQNSRIHRRVSKPRFPFEDSALLLDETDTKFKCSVCHRMLATKLTLKKHILSKHIRLKPFACSVCDKKFIFAKALEAHEQLHSEVPQYFCICGKAYKVKSSYLDHIRRLHQAVSSTSFLCAACDKSFYDNQSLRIHTNSVHKPKTIQCDFPSCNKVFSTVSLMHAHARCHTSSKFMCADCGKTFKTKSNHRKHMLNHKGIRSFNCQECEKSYLSLSHLNQHRKRAHSTAANFQCTFCGKLFKIKEQMIYHEYSHQGKKPFVCDLCGYATSYRNTLLSHRKKIHFASEKKAKNRKKKCCEKLNFLNNQPKLDNRELVCSGQKSFRTSSKSVDVPISCAVSASVISEASAITDKKKLKTKSTMKKSNILHKVKSKAATAGSQNSSDIFGSTAADEVTTLNVGESFLPVPSSYLWKSDYSPGWSSSAASNYYDKLSSIKHNTPADKSVPNKDISMKEISSTVSGIRMSRNITLNCTAMDTTFEMMELPCGSSSFE